MDKRIGNLRVRILSLDGPGVFTRAELPARTWRRAAEFTRVFGIARALELTDARAERALERGNVQVAIRWRDLIVAIPRDE
jgi:hypothetical protein